MKNTCIRISDFHTSGLSLGLTTSSFSVYKAGRISQKSQSDPHSPEGSRKPVVPRSKKELENTGSDMSQEAARDN